MTDRPRRRWRQPEAANTLVVVMAAIAGVLGVVLTACVVVLFARTTIVADRADRAAARSLEAAAHANDALERIDVSRRENARDVCQSIEALKGGLRVIVRAFKIDPERLPIDPATGRRPLEPVPGGCDAEVERLLGASP